MTDRISDATLAEIEWLAAKAEAAWIEAYNTVDDSPEEVTALKRFDIARLNLSDACNSRVMLMMARELKAARATEVKG